MFSIAATTRCRSSSSTSRKWLMSIALTGGWDAGERPPCRESSFGSLRSPLLRCLVVDQCERGAQQRAHAAHLAQQAVVVGAGVARDRPRLGASLLDDQLGLLARLLLERDRSLLRGHERRPQQALDLAVPDEIVLELVDLV